MARRKNLLKEYRYLIVSLVILFAIILASRFYFNSNTNITYNTLDLSSDLFPREGFQTKIILGNVIPKLVESGAIDLEKTRQIYGGLEDWQLKILTEPSNKPLTLTKENANFLLTVLWPLGISNKNPILDQTSQYSGVANLASTGGWILGKENAMTYFNKLELIKLTSEQQAILEEVAGNTYRPCCDNPTSFPDCNHGAALLALLELGASQGLSRGELYTLALQANTLWFPQQYLSTATYLKTKNVDYWTSAEEIMNYRYSAITGWINNVYKPLQKEGLLPQTQRGASCGV